MHADKNPQYLSAFYISLAASLWAFDGIIFRPYLFTLPVSLVVFIETFLVSIISLPILIKHRLVLSQLKIKDWMSFLGVAILGGAIGTMAITKALFYVQFINLSIVVFIQKLQPVFAILLAAFFLKEKLSTSFIVWGALAIIGGYIIAFGLTLPLLGSGDKTLEATLFALLAAFSFGSSTVLSKRALRNVSFELGTYLRFSITAFIMSIIILLAGSYSSVSDITPRQLFVFFLIAFSTGGPAILIYYYGLKKIKASVATICELVFPLTAVMLEYFVYDKILSPVQWVGAFLIIISILRVSGVNFFNFKKQNH
jgi:drug/metabolite transporter (DMT)-like permease